MSVSSLLLLFLLILLSIFLFLSLLSVASLFSLHHFLFPCFPFFLFFVPFTATSSHSFSSVFSTYPFVFFVPISSVFYHPPLVHFAVLLILSFHLCWLYLPYAIFLASFPSSCPPLSLLSSFPTYSFLICFLSCVPLFFFFFFFTIYLFITSGQVPSFSTFVFFSSS